MENMLDVLIIGGGPIGLSCALSAQQKGLRYTIIEKGALVDSLYHYPVNMTFFQPQKNSKLEAYPSLVIIINLPVTKPWNIIEG